METIGMGFKSRVRAARDHARDKDHGPGTESAAHGRRESSAPGPETATATDFERIWHLVHCCMVEGLQDATYQAAVMAHALHRGYGLCDVEPATALWRLLAMLDTRLDGDDRPLIYQSVEDEIRRRRLGAENARFRASADALYDGAYEFLKANRVPAADMPDALRMFAEASKREFTAPGNWLSPQWREHWREVSAHHQNDPAIGKLLVDAALKMAHVSDFAQDAAVELDRAQCPQQTHVRALTWGRFYLLLREFYTVAEIATIIKEACDGFKYMPGPCVRFIERYESDEDASEDIPRLVDRLERLRKTHARYQDQPYAAVSRALGDLKDHTEGMVNAAWILDQPCAERIVEQVKRDVQDAIGRYGELSFGNRLFATIDECNERFLGRFKGTFVENYDSYYGAAKKEQPDITAQEMFEAFAMVMNKRCADFESVSKERQRVYFPVLEEVRTHWNRYRLLCARAAEVGLDATVARGYFDAIRPGLTLLATQFVFCPGVTDSEICALFHDHDASPQA